MIEDPGSQVILVTAGLGKHHWHRAAKRLVQQAVSLGVCSRGVVASEEVLRGLDGYRELVEGLPAKPGYHLWGWKPFVVAEGLRQMRQQSDLRYLIYLDAGFEVNPSLGARSRFKDYLDISDEQGVAVMDTGYVEWRYSKPEVLEHFGLSLEARQSGQFQAGSLIFSLQAGGEEIARQWLEACALDRGRLLREPPSGRLPHGFVGHRHDQAVLSGMLKSRGVRAIPNETFFAPEWQESGARYPFWALRNPSGAPYFGEGPSHFLRRNWDRLEYVNGARIRQKLRRIRGRHRSGGQDSPRCP